MGNRAVQAKATNKHGDELTVQSQETDSPILPVAQLEQLHSFRPDLVDFVIDQTKAEAEFRRKRDMRINLFIFLERILGQILALAVAAFGICGGIYAGLHGQAWLGGTIATVTVGTLAVAFLHRNRSQNTQTTPAPKRK